MVDLNTQLPSLPAAGAANLTDLLLARQGTVDRKLTIQILQDLLLGNLSGADILAKLAPVDGAGSGLDSDLLDGQHGSFYQNASNINTGIIPQARLSASDILTLTKTVDGAGSGLDADLLDGQHGSFYQNASNLNAGTVNNSRLNSASTSLAGIIEIATQAEVNAGTAGNLAVIASTLLNGVEYNFNSNGGHIKFPSWLGNLQICWGFATVGGNSIVGDTYSRNFTSVMRTYCSYFGTIGGGDSACSVSSASTASINLQNTADGTRNINWLVIGIG